jgi:feruloyl-CoA synthase
MASLRPLSPGDVVRDPTRLFAKAAVSVERRADGSILLNATQPLGKYPRAINEHLVCWAQRAPERAFLLERGSDGSWNGVTYKQALVEVMRIAGALLGLRISPQHPVAILSESSVEHGLLMLAAMHVGIPVLPISSAYSLASSDFGKLKSIIRRTAPAVIYVDNHERYAPALTAIAGLHEASVIIGGKTQQLKTAQPSAATYGAAQPAVGTIRFGDFRRDDAAAVARAFEAVTPDTVAKILFTSGSTAEPKGVINTQRMLCSNQQAKAQVWPFLEKQPPVLVDWLPWNHTFGGNHNFNMVLRNGGTLYIDGGRPVPAQFARSLENLRDIAPTLYFNVPRGFELLIPALQGDTQLRERFFSRLQLIFYAAASLPSHLWDALIELSVRATGAPVPLISAWGSTETAPLATDCHFQAPRPGVIGLPVPGCELKLLATGAKWEVRVRGANIFPGYWGEPDLTARQFDEEGFYCIGDAVRFADDSAPERGLVFDGRISEDFKLTTGTWVSVGNLRVRAVAALAPIAQDVVVAGHERSEIRFLIFLNIAACRTLCPDLTHDAPVAEVIAHAGVRARVAQALDALHRETPGSSTHATGALLLSEPPSIDAGEMTDKGYINQRAVLTRRNESVEALFTPGHSALISLPTP